MTPSADTGKFYKLPKALAGRADLRPGEKLVLCILLDREGRNGESWPGVNRISRDAGLSKATVVRAIRALEEKSWLKVERRGSGYSNRYQVATGIMEEPGAECDLNRCQFEAQGGIKMSPELDSLNQTQGTKPKEEVFIPEALRAIRGFEEIWREWLGYRRERRLSTSPMTLRRQLAFLAGQANPVECIERSIRNGWQGLFEAKGNGYDQSRSLAGRQFAAGDQQPGKFDGKCKTVLSNQPGV